MYKVFIIIYLFLLSAIAKEWIIITPLPHCEKFQVEYSYDGMYEIRYKESLDTDYKTFHKKIESINDLSVLTDELVDISYNYCPLNIVLTEIDNTYICAPEELSTKPFSEDYTSLLHNIVNVIDKAGKNCEDVIPLISLQNKIAQLNQKQLLNFDLTRSIFKIPSDSKTDKLIDHYYECGGPPSSAKFVENLILLEAKNACLFPSPPGKLKFNDAKAIAKKVAKNFPGLGLLSLNSKKEQITKAAITEFANAVLFDQVSNILGDTIDTKSFVDGLKVSKDLKNIRPASVTDYTTHVLSIDAPLEIIDKGLPYLIKNNFSSMLPNSISEKEKNEFIDKKITPKIRKEYEECIAETKEKLDYPFSGEVTEERVTRTFVRPNRSRTRKKVRIQTSKELNNFIGKRKSLASDFCKKNPKECLKQGCEKVQNYSTTRSDISDMNIIQSCLFKGLTHSVKPILHKIISLQKESFKKNFTMSEKLVDELSNKAYKEIYQCADKKVKKGAKLSYKEGFTENLEALLHTDTNQFKEALVTCAKNIEIDLTKTMANLLISNMDVVKEAFGNDKETNFHDQILNQGAFDFAQKTSLKAVQACLSSQRTRVNEKKMSAISCRPMIEMEVGSEIIKKVLYKTLKESKVSKQNSDKVIKKFNICSQKAIVSGNQSVFNTNHKTPIQSPEDANEYLTKNHEFYGCVDLAIKESVNLVTERTLARIEKVNKDKIKDMTLFRRLRPSTKIEVVSCFNEGLKDISSWPDFLKFNERNGLDDIKKICTEKATYMVLPKIIANEIEIKLKGINDSNLVVFGATEINKELNNIYDLNLPLNHNLSPEEVIRKSYDKFNKSNPNLDLNAFVTDFTSKIQTKVLAHIKKNILPPVLKSKYDFYDLDKTLTVSCLNTIYKANIKNLETIAKISKSNPLKDPQKLDLKKILVDLIKDGLATAKKMKRYPIFISGVKKVCKSPKKYKDMMDIARLGIADDIVLNQIATKVRKSFKEVAAAQCHEELEKQKSIFNLQVSDKNKQKLCSTKKLTDKEFEDVKWNILIKFNNLDHRALVDFILKRKNDTLNLIESDLTLDFMNGLFYKDKALLSSIYDNFTGVIGRDPKAVEKIKLIAVNKLFEDKKKGSFTSKFIESQLVAGIGIIGLPVANDKVAQNLSELGPVKKLFKSKAYPKAYTEYYKRWNGNGVKHFLNWDNLSQAKRESLINTVINGKILTRFDSNLLEDTAKIKKLNDKLTKQITDHVLKDKNFKNPNYSGSVFSSETPYLTFVEILALDINESTTSGIVDDYKKKFNYIKGKVKDLFTNDL